MKTEIQSVDQYIGSFPEEIQKRLEQVRAIIKSVAPLAKEAISYGIPGYKFHGQLIYFSGFKSHIGLYPMSDQMVEAIPEVAQFRTSKGTAQFKHDQPLPLELVKKIVKFRLEENLAKAKS
ncbi:DUF1801 domain-containing protein [Patescibacteria group bacterium]|nr:DUF1801 domain-containing protein [Patescibacteria group bacterium]